MANAVAQKKSEDEGAVKPGGRRATSQVQKLTSTRILLSNQ